LTARMANAHKTSRKSAASRKRDRRASTKPGKLAELDQIVVNMRDVLGELQALVQSRKHGRVPLPEYARVVAVGKSDEVAEIRGQAGIVLDAANDQSGRTYTVYFPARQEAFVLHEQSLWDTGETVPEDVIYGGGQTRRVHVDKDGGGTLVA
jgi:hypothetical protein